MSYDTTHGDILTVYDNVSIEPKDKSVKSKFMTVIMVNGREIYHIFSDNKVILERITEDVKPK